MSDIRALRNVVEQQKGRKAQIAENLKSTLQNVEEKKEDLQHHEQAREVIREVGLATQQQLQYHISEITTLAMEAVFDDPYELEAEFVQRRNKTECDLYFVRNEDRMDPLSASGGGTVDVAAFALRVASWSMQRPRSRNVLILDEPFKHLKGIEENTRVLEMVSEISEKLGVQIIMVSDERIPKELILEAADKVFEVSKHKGRTEVR